MTIFEHKPPEWHHLWQKNFVALSDEIDRLVKDHDDWCGHQRVSNPAVYVFDWLHSKSMNFPIVSAEDRAPIFRMALWHLFGIASPEHAIRAVLAAQEKIPPSEVMNPQLHDRGTIMIDEWQWHQEHPERHLWLWTRVGIRWVPYGRYTEHDGHRRPIPES